MAASEAQAGFYYQNIVAAPLSTQAPQKGNMVRYWWLSLTQLIFPNLPASAQSWDGVSREKEGWQNSKELNEWFRATGFGCTI